MNLLKLANPVYVTKGAFGLAGTAVGLADTMARETAHLMVSTLHHLKEAAEDAAAPTTEAQVETVVAETDDAAPGPTVVLAEPHAPEEPPVDVVGQALAAEAASVTGPGGDSAPFAHEPRAASRDEEHGDAALQRAEVDEIADETAAALEGDVEPVEHLTEPLLDPADAKAMAAELRTMSRAADPDKG